jgi:hypothetical protein
MHSEQIPTSSPGVIWRILDDSAVLVSPEAGQVRVLNEVGTTIWQLIDGENTLAHIEAELIRHYGISPERARADLHTFLANLAERGLLTWKTSDQA